MRLLVISLVLWLSACGGGSDDSQVARQEPVKATPAAICLHGNSVMRGSFVLPGNQIVRSQFSPEFVLGWNFPNHLIRDYSVNGQTVMGMRALPDWPRQNCSVDVILHYHNDNHLTNFEQQLNLAITESTGAKKMLVIANLPSDPVPPVWQYMAGNTDIVRRVAAQRGVHLCDMNMGTSLNASDMLHPNDTGYAVLSGGMVRCLRAAGVQ